MWRYLKAHERFVTDSLARAGDGTSMAELKEFHERQLRYMQHERLIHLIVTLSVSTYLLLIIGFIAVHPIWPAFALAALLFALVCAYVVHYFRLENGVQRWYHLTNRIDERLGRVSQRYEPPS
jgi:hypothetical protein